jgi:hypothetical protein
MQKHKSYGSPASLGASKGAGPVAGAGMHVPPAAGPGRAAAKKIGMKRDMYNSRPVPSGKSPAGMKTYREE